MQALGIVSSLSRPGGNITWLSIFTPGLAAKRLDLLKDMLPSLQKAAVISNANNPVGGKLAVDEVISMAATLKVEFFFSSRRRHTRCLSDWSSDVCSSD